MLQVIIIALLFPCVSFASQRRLPILRQGFPAHRPPKIRVRIGHGMNEVKVSGRNLKRNILLTNDSRKFEGNKVVRFNCVGKTQRYNSKPIHFASLSSGSGNLSFQNRKYYGKLHILTAANKSKCDVVNELSLEKYIETLLPKEMSSSWPLEVLKAQAIAARTYALHKINTKQVSRELGHEAYYDLENSEKHQVNGSVKDVTIKTQDATDLTRGQVLVSQSGEIIPIFFHAQCGGKTFRPEYVWDNLVEDYLNVDCGFCTKEKGIRVWDNKVKNTRFRSFLKWLVKEKFVNLSLKTVLAKKIVVAPDRTQNKALRVYVDDGLMVIAKSLLRRYFGRVLIPSNNFTVTMFEKDISFNGQGNGHGVGLCQLGALHLAKKGWGFKKILAHYFPKHILKKLY